MKLRSICKTLALSGTTLALVLFASSSLFAFQMSSYPSQSQQPAANPAAPAAPGTAATPAPAPKVDPQEEADYKTFYELKPDDTDQHIALGTAFVQKYPDSKYTEAVYSQMANAEYKKQDFDKMFADADKAIALNPDDVTVLVIAGWVIPHTYNPDDPQADAKLAKAEKYEKHALEVLPTITKPAAMTTMTDEQFAKAKTESESQAHSGLGLVYFREQKYDGAVTELTKAVATTATPDPTDYFVLGISLNKLDKYSDAADAFTKCAAIPGGLQGRCKQQADDAKKQAASKPAPPK
jgi:tetratricopeptide (TPR) repeat protein